jgi:hypothetical protein
VLDNDLGRLTKLNMYSKYKFTLAFENAIARDYVTEKFYEPLLSGSVPIYLGAPNIAEFSPGDNCFINTKDFNSPANLGEYIKFIANDPVVYSKFFEWKKKPFLPEFKVKLNIQKQHYIKRLCIKIQEKLQQLPSV